MGWNDAVTGCETLRPNVSETSVYIDDLARSLVLIAACGDSFSFRLNQTASISDSFSMIDDISARIPFYGALSESSVMSDSVSGLIRFRYIFGDDATLTLIDLVDKSLLISGATPLEYPFSETCSYADLLSAIHRHLASASESTSYSDETRALNKLFAIISETSVLSDDISALQSFLGIASDAASFGESFDLILLLRSEISEALALVDEAIGQFNYLSAIGDDASLDLADLIVKTLVDVGGAVPLSYPFSDIASYTDSLQAMMNFKGSLGDDFDGRLNHLVSVFESLGMVDEVTGQFIYQAGLSEDLAVILQDLVAKLLVEIGQATPLPYSFSDDTTSNWQDLATALQKLRASVSELSSYSDAAIAIRLLVALLSDSLSFADSSAGRLVYRPSLSDEFSNLSELVSGRFNYRASFSDSATFVDLLTKTLIEIGQALKLEYPFSEDVGITDSIAGLKPFYASFSDASSYTDTLQSLHRLVANLLETLVQTDSISARFRYHAGLSETIGSADDLIGRFIYKASISDTSTLSDDVSQIKGLLASSSDLLTFNEDLTSRFPICAGLVESLELIEEMMARFSYFASIGDLANADLFDLITKVLADSTAVQLLYAFSEDATLRDTLRQIIYAASNTTPANRKHTTSGVRVLTIPISDRTLVITESDRDA